MKSKTEVRVRFVETDAMGIVWHGNYFAYFEQARVELMDKMGLPYAQLAQLGYHLPLTEVSLKYLKPARFDDRLTIECTCPPLDGVRLRITYKIHRGAELIAEGFTAHAFINSSGRPCRPPEVFTKALSPHHAKQELSPKKL